MLRPHLIIRRLGANLLRATTATLRCTGLIATGALLIAGHPAVWANPGAPIVAAGQATFSRNGTTFTIDQATPHAIVNWDTFGNRAGETIRFHQPNATAAILNRVTGGESTRILGDLTANGRVFVLNPNGVLVGAGARIDTHGFYASTHELADAAFLADGDLVFSGDSRASVVNLGTITAHDGDLALIARTVENHGTLQAPRGTVGLAAGTAVLLKAAGNDRIYILAGAASDTATRGVNNTGVVTAAQAELKAAGGNAYALAVNNGGAITATGIATRDGRVVLTADGGDVAVSGQLAARRADGSGGEILVGGDYQGSNAVHVARAANTTITSTATLDASATDSAHDGGRIVVWSDGHTRFDGAIAATGARGGDAEVSGRQLVLTGHADLRSMPGGTDGTLLLDPTDLTITNSSAAYDPGATGASTVGATWINTQLASASVSLTAADTITGNADAPIAWNTPNRLTLTAGTSITLNGAITGSHAASEFALFTASIVNANAAVAVGTLRYGSGGGAKQTFNFSHAANQIARLIVNDGEGSGQARFSSLFNVVSNRPLTLGRAGSPFVDAFHVESDGAPITIRANGDLVLEHAYTAISANTGNLTLRAVGGQFVNRASYNTLTTGNGARALVYSTSPLTFNGTAFEAGGLTGFTQQRGVAADTVAAPGTGNLFYFTNHLLTLTPLDATRTYGAANPAFNYNITANSGPATPTLTGLALGTTATAASNAGTYTITASGATAPDYDITYGTGTLTVNRAALTVTATLPNRTYGADNGSFTVNYSGLVNHDAGASVVTPTVTTAATAQTAAGPSAITVSGPAQTTNYDITYHAGSFAITPAPLTVTARDASRSYGDANPAFTAFGTGYVNGQDDSLLRGVTFTTAATLTANVGTYTITPAGGSAPNYAITQYLPGTLTINPANLLIQIHGASRTYGAANPAITGTVLSGLRNGDVFNFAALGLTTAATATSGVGTYAITGVAGPVGNYLPAISGSPSLTITPAPLTLTANNATRTWNDPDPAFTYTLTGLVNGDAAPALTGLGFTTPAQQSSNIGSYAITPFASGIASANYTIGATANGTLTIVPLAITLTADPFSRLYGDANPLGFSGTYATTNAAANTSGVLTFGTAAIGSAHFALGSATNATTGVGAYDFTAAASGTGAGNLVLTLAPGSGKLTIHPAPLTVTPYLTLTAGTAGQPDYTASSRSVPVTQVTVDYKPTGSEYVVTTYKQEAANTSGGVTHVKVVSTPLGANAITGTNPDGTVRMQVLNVRYTSADGVTYTRDTTPGVDNSEGTITFNPNTARAITIADPLPGIGLITSGLKNNDRLSVSYTRPGMPSANASYSLTDVTVDAGANYSVAVNTADLSYRLNPLRLQLVLPDITIPANFFLPDDATASFNITDDLTLDEYTRIYLGQIQLLNAPAPEAYGQAASALRVTRSLGAGTPATPPVVSMIDDRRIITGTNVTVVVPGQSPTRPVVPATGATAIEHIPGFTLAHRDFIADEINRIASLIGRGVSEQTGHSPAELRNFYPVTPSISFNNPYLAAGADYPLTYKTILPSGALIKTPKTWSNLIVSPELPQPLPPDSQNAGAGIAAAQAALDQLRAETFGNLEGRIKSIAVGSINNVEYLRWREFPELYIQIPDRGTNVFGLTAASDEFLGQALWLWAVSRGLPVSRGGATAGDIALWYQLAALNPQFKAEVAGFLALQMSDILARDAAHAFDPAKHSALSPAEAGFLADFNAYIAEQQAIAFNRAAAAQESWINERSAVAVSNVQSTNGSLLSLYNTGHIGEAKPPPPEAFRKAAANWVPEVNPTDPAFQTVLATIGLGAPGDNNSSNLTQRGGTAPSSAIHGTVGAFIDTPGRQFVDDAVIEAMLSGPLTQGYSQSARTALSSGLSTSARLANLSDDIVSSLFPHSISATMGTVVSGVLMGASLVTEAILGVVMADIEAAQFTKKMNDLREQVSTDPKTTLDILRNNPFVNRPNSGTQGRAMQNQLETRGYNDASMVALMGMFTAMVCTDVDPAQYAGAASTSQLNPNL